MPPETILILTYIAFIWLVVLHTFEEIGSGIMEQQIGHIKLTQKRYLFGASLISTVNLGTLALIVMGLSAGFFIGLFTTAIFGVFQALVHTIGYFREGRKSRGLGAGFFSSIPLAITGLIVFIQLLRIITSL